MKNRILFPAAFALLLSACGQPPPAPYVNMGLRTDAAGAAIAQEGDTPYTIAQRYRLPVQDVIAMNNLSPPYTLSAGQRLRLPPPVDYTVHGGDTVFGVSRLFGIEVSQLVKTNGLQSPYILTPGQVLRVPSSSSASAGVYSQPDSYSAPAYGAAPVPVDSAPPASSSAFPPAVEAVPLDSPVSAAPAAAPAPLPQTTGDARGTGFIWPVKGRVLSNYGPKKDGLYNDGINIAAPRGAPVSAAADGVIAYVGDSLQSYGNLVLIRHADGVVTAYAHLSSVRVKAGERVNKGQTIGAVGSTGSVDSAQLHFEVRRGTQTLDPRRYLG